MNESLKSILESSSKRKEDVDLYEIALKEIEQEKTIKGVWAKAMSMSNGGDQKTKSKYLELRVRLLRDEIRESEEESYRQSKEAMKPTPDEIKKNSHNELTNSSLKLLGRIRGASFFISFCGLISLALGIFFVQESGINDGSDIIVLIIGIVLSTLGVFLFTNYRKMLKEIENFDFVKKNITTVSILSIIVSVVMMVTGVVAPIIGIVGAFFFLSIIINIVKFHFHYNKYKKFN